VTADLNGVAVPVTLDDEALQTIAAALDEREQVRLRDPRRRRREDPPPSRRPREMGS
jgi:hypothetical protein